MISLKNKKILITGASGDLGKTTAIILSKLGAKLVLVARNTSRLKEIISLLEGEGHHSITADLSDIGNITNVMTESVKYDNQKLSGLVYCAGVIPIRPIKSTKIDFLHETMLINFYAFVETSKLFSNKKISEGGSIVAISSYASHNGEKGQLAYASSKGAIDSTIPVMAKEFFSKNIRVNSIRPAVFKGEQTNIDLLNESTKKTIDKMKTGLIEMENIAEQISFLLSDSSSGVYGRCFEVRGYMS